MNKFRLFGGIMAGLAMMLIVAGCGKEEAQQQAVVVNTYKIVATDTQLLHRLTVRLLRRIRQQFMRAYPVMW